jgi:secreted trypsin-like serine protease
MRRFILPLFVIIFISFTTIDVYATDDLVWAIPKPDTLKNDQGYSAGAELRSLPESLSTSRPFIVGGSETPLGKYPEYAVLWADGLDGYWYAICGASLVDSTKILTAAHCTYDYPASRLAVIPSFHSFSEDAAYDNLIFANQKVEHPNYDDSSRGDDIAILTLKEQVATTKAQIYGGAEQLTGYTATVIGTGRLSGDGDTPDTLQEVDLPIVSNSQCADAWGASAITSAMMCAGGTSSGGIGACSGDSGGPLFVSLYGKRVQAGIVSWGHEDCAVPNYYDVYARTSALIDFINQNAPSATIILDLVGSSSSINLLLLDDE